MWNAFRERQLIVRGDGTIRQWNEVNNKSQAGSTSTGKEDKKVTMVKEQHGDESKEKVNA